MVAIFRNDEWISIQGMTFSQFLKEGYQGNTATLEDWIVHLSFIYTDARIKNYIELRVCDSVPPCLVPSVQAVTKAFVYHKDGPDVMKEITRKWTTQDFQNVYEKVARQGLSAKVHGISMLDYCKGLLEVATFLLRASNESDEDDKDES